MRDCQWPAFRDEPVQQKSRTRPARGRVHAKRIMKHRYEALLVLNTQGREETVKDVVDRLESEFQKEGAEIEQVQKMDKRQFSYVAGELDAGHYVNFVFHADPQLITKLRAKFKLDPEVYRQHYQKLRPKTEKKERGAKKLAEAE